LAAEKAKSNKKKRKSAYNSSKFFFPEHAFLFPDPKADYNLNQ
jgi:hypothetical protein